MTSKTSQTNAEYLPGLQGAHARHTGEWFCVQAKHKHEHLASAYLNQIFAVDTFLPRIRFKRTTRYGLAWVTEAMFPGYLFARFDLRRMLGVVQYACGVRSVVHFGDKWPTISLETIEALRRALGPNEVHIVQNSFEPGDAVMVAEGTFKGITGVIARVLPAQERIALLMDFLGRQVPVELGAEAVTLLEKPGRQSHSMAHDRAL